MTAGSHLKKNGKGERVEMYCIEYLETGFKYGKMVSSNFHVYDIL